LKALTQLMSYFQRATFSESSAAPTLGLVHILQKTVVHNFCETVVKSTVVEATMGEEAGAAMGLPFDRPLQRRHPSGGSRRVVSNQICCQDFIYK
jgi:hypothetical protein